VEAAIVDNVVDLHGQPARLEDDELVENLARFADGTLSAAAVKARHRLSDADWAAMGEDNELVRRIEDRKLQRIRGGQTKRERAQIEVADAAPILGKLMRSPDTNARHIIDSVKTLDALATGGGEAAAAAGTTFEITINLSGDGPEHILHFSKPIAVGATNDADDSSADDVDTTNVIAAIAMNKSTDGDNGGHL
jgi:hypothetical protein